MADTQTAFGLVDSYFAANLSMLNLPGMAIGLTDGKHLLRVSTYGYADLAAAAPVEPETLFEIGSISKSFASILILQLHEEGRLDIHAPLKEYLPWFEVKSSFEPITLHHIMTHSAGIVRGNDATGSTAYQVWALRDTQTGTPPGSFFHYSNAGYKTLGLILERLLGQPIDQIMRERLFEPLGMAASQPVITHNTRRRLAVGYEPFYDDRPLPRGGLLAPATWLEDKGTDGAISSTAADMAAYMRLLLNRGQGPAGRLLSEASFDLLTQSAIQPEDGEHGEFYGYGLNVGPVDGAHCLWHSGGMVGYRAMMQVDLDHGLGVIILTNGPSCRGKASIEGLGWFALRALRATHLGQELPQPPLADPFHLGGAPEYAGTYAGDRGHLTFLAQGGALHLKHDRASIPLQVVGDECFYANHPDWALYPFRFVREQGQIREVVHGPHSYASEASGERTAGDAPQVWQALTGHYRSYNPWMTNFRVIQRGERLLLLTPDGDEERLVLQEDGSFRVGDDERLPECLRFDTIVDGQALRARFTGDGDYHRTFTP
jgi:CubicO group peptidase (beta-lactamase class C family)